MTYAYLHKSIIKNLSYITEKSMGVLSQFTEFEPKALA